MKIYKFKYKGLKEVNSKSNSKAWKKLRKALPDVKDVTALNLTLIK